MNKVMLFGRLTRDVDLRYSQGSEESTAVARFSIAVNRPKKNSNGQNEADFPSCIAFGRTAENIEKYFSKGSRIVVTGRIQTGSYTDRNGNKVYTTDVVVEAFDFVDPAQAAGQAAAPPPQAMDPAMQQMWQQFQDFVTSNRQ